MSLRTPEEYIKSLKDGRCVYYRGEKVKDVTTHPVLKTAVEHASIDYAMAEDEKYKELAAVKDGDKTYSRYFYLPKTTEDLLKRSALIEAATKEGATLVTLIKEIGTDALFALHITAKKMDKKFGTHYYERVKKFYEHCRDNDLSMCVAQTDVKGDRSLGPREQEHPDYYVRIVEEKKDGIVVRGAKIHTSVSINSNELIVIPTRAMREEDKNYAVAFAIPVDTKGVKLISSSYGEPHAHESQFENPISSKHKMVESLTVFEDVFVPNERIFMKGEWQYAVQLALGFVEFHRFTAVSYKLPLIDLFVGVSQLISEYNGIEKASHIRDKIAKLMAYAATVRGLIYMSAVNCKMDEGLAVPDPLLSNTSKYHFAVNYQTMLNYIQDIAGGLLVTAPSEEDFTNPETKELMEKYLGAKKGVPVKDRIKLLKLISDLTVGDFGGYQQVLAVHAEGSIEAEKLTIYRAFDVKSAVDYAKTLTGIK